MENSPESEKWMKVLKERKKELPLVNFLYEAGQKNKSSNMNISTYINIFGTVGGLVGLYNYRNAKKDFKGRIKAAKSPIKKSGIIQDEKISRRKFFKSLALGSSAMVASRLADTHTTGSGMRNYENFLSKIRSTSEYRNLPGEIQNKLFPHGSA